MREKRLSESEVYERAFQNARFETVSSLLWLGLFVCILLAIFTFHSYASNFKGVWVRGESMSLTLRDGDALLMKLTESGAKAERGDIIVVDVSGYEECKDIKDGFLIKRLIATEGDKVRCKDGQIEVLYSGESEWTLLDEPYAYYGQNDNYKQYYDFTEYAVGEGEIFFLGDNRSSEVSSCDSRFREDNGSHLSSDLYKERDIHGVIVEDSLGQRAFWKKYFTFMAKVEKFMENYFAWFVQ